MELGDLLATVDGFAGTHGVPVAVNEFGVIRWVPGAAEFVDDEMDLFEARGMNHALWVWDPAWEPWDEVVDAFNFRHGPDPQNHQDVESSDLMDVILDYWGRNTIRPSSVPTTTLYLTKVLKSAGGGAAPMPLELVGARREGPRLQQHAFRVPVHPRFHDLARGQAKDRHA
jgi:hypothetical protein